VPYARPGEPVGPDFYTSYLQFTWPATMMIVRATGDPTALVPALRRAVAAVDPHLPIYDVRTIEERSADALASERFATLVLGIFAGLGLLLAALGIYGVMTYSVAQRRREIGIRLALGATPREVLRLVVGHGTALAGAGLAAGAVVSIALSRTLSALVADVGAADPLVLAAAVSALLLVALLTAYLPARSATRVNPVETLAAD
jgi:putative ABC transport system permease protein